MIRDESTGASRAFVVVTFVDYDSVDKCVLESVQTPHMVNGRLCNVKKCPSKDELRKVRMGP
jgi:hypothetical protein